jgi:hypothetical protein
MADTTEATIGAGTELAFWDTEASPDAYTVVDSVRSITGPSQSKSEVDSTTLDSTAIERISGLSDGEQITIVLADNAASKALCARWFAAASIDFRETYPEDIFSPVQIDYYTVVPLKNDGGTTTPNNLKERTFTGRITGSVTGTDPHGI